MGATAESLLTPSVLGLIESLVGQGQIDAAVAILEGPINPATE